MGAEGFDLAAYFRRIGFFGEPRPDFATLRELHCLHVTAIAFENLDPLLRRPVSVEPAVVAAKLVNSRRGGYCFEQNALFRSALQAIGFSVTGLAGRVRWMSAPDAPMSPRSHMLLKVDLPDGSYLADVGFGANLQDAPLRMIAGLEQRTAMSTYRLIEAEPMLGLQVFRTAAWRTAFVFNFEAQQQSDYMVSNWFTSTAPTALFTRALLAERLEPPVRYTLVNRRLTERGPDAVERTREIASAEELADVLGVIFRLDCPAPISELWARVPEGEP